VRGGGEETASPDDPITEAELEAALADIEEDALTHEELAEVVSDLEESAQEVLMDALPGIAEEVGQKMATGGRGYTGSIQSEYAPGARSTPSGAGRNPVADGTAEKMEAGGSGRDSESVDYTDEIAAAFQRGN